MLVKCNHKANAEQVYRGLQAHRRLRKIDGLE